MAVHLPRLDAALDRVCGDHGVELLRDLVRIDSTYPPGHEVRLATEVAERLAATGVAVEVQPFDGDRANMIGRLRGTGARGTLAFSGHFDTVPVGHEPWAHPPYGGVIADGRVYGRGAADMKGGLAAIMLAVEALTVAEVEVPGDVVLAFTSGETNDCVGAQKLVADGHLADVEAVVVGEPTGLEIGIVEKAALWLRVSAQGRSGHTAQPEAGANAIESLVRFLGRVSALDFGMPDHPLLDPPTVAVGTVNGGVSVNLMPDHCVAELDLRLLPEQEEREVLAAVRALATPDLTVEPFDFKPAVVTAVDDPVVRAVRSAHARVLGVDREPVGLPYYTDAAVLCPALGIPMVLLGPGGRGMSHQTDEYCEVDHLASAARIYAHTVVEYLRPGII